jgi:hypothetical protein
MKIDQRSPLLKEGRELRQISSPAEPKSAAIGMEGKRAEITLYQTPIDLDPSPALSLVGKAKPMVKGLKIGALVSDGADGDRLQALRDALEGEEAELAIVAPKIGGVRLKSGKDLAADIALSGAPSVFFDAAAIFASAQGVSRCSRTALRSIGFETLSRISKLLAIRQRRSLSSQRRALPSRLHSHCRPMALLSSALPVASTAHIHACGRISQCEKWPVITRWQI